MIKSLKIWNPGEINEDRERFIYFSDFRKGNQEMMSINVIE